MSKVTVTYHAPHDDNAVVEMGGFRFFDGMPQEIEQDEHPALIKKLRTNMHFDTDGGEIAAEVDPAPPADHEPNQSYRAIHNGGGRYIVVFGDKDEKVASGLTKIDADAFNTLSDEDKVAYLSKDAE